MYVSDTKIYGTTIQQQYTLRNLPPGNRTQIGIRILFPIVDRNTAFNAFVQFHNVNQCLLGQYIRTTR